MPSLEPSAMDAETEQLFVDYHEAVNLFERKKKKEAFVKYSDFINKCQISLEKQLEEKFRKHLLKHLALAYNNRGFISYLLVDFDDAIRDFSHAVNNDPLLTVAWYNRGLVSYRLGKFESALSDQNQALLLDKQFEPAKDCLEQVIADQKRLS